MKKEHKFLMHIEKDLIQELQAVAKQNRISTSELIREIARQYLVYWREVGISS